MALIHSVQWSPLRIHMTGRGRIVLCRVRSEGKTGWFGAASGVG